MDCFLESDDLNLLMVGGPLDAALATCCMSAALGSTRNSPVRRCRITCELYHLLEHCANGLNRIKMPRSAKASVSARPKSVKVTNRTTTGCDRKRAMSPSAWLVTLVARSSSSLGVEQGGEWTACAQLRMMT